MDVIGFVARFVLAACIVCVAVAFWPVTLVILATAVVAGMME